jgi:L-fucose mutarotase/ribose pyranase (RbsD/FucU family)
MSTIRQPPLPKKTTYGELIDLTGCDIPRATTAILSLMTLDTFVDTPVMRMQRMFPLSIVQRTDNFLFLFTFFELGAWS